MPKFPLPSPLFDTIEYVSSKPPTFLPAFIQKDYKLHSTFLNNIRETTLPLKHTGAKLKDCSNGQVISEKNPSSR
jgi:hypothetical protein